MKLLFVHGWGFDRSIWDRVIAALPGHEACAADRGYFGMPDVGVREHDSPGGYIAVTHSFGTMAWLQSPPPACRGLIAINGFDRFAEAPGRAGIARRLLDRMVARFDAAPAQVLAEFRSRCGGPPATRQIDTARLRCDLLRLRDGDRRDAVADLALPVLSLQGEADPLLPAAMRAVQFDGATQVTRQVLADGGHLLPLTHAQECAARIDAFAMALA